MKMSGLAVAAGLLLASFGTATVAQAQAPTVVGWQEVQYERGRDDRRLDRRDDRRIERRGDRRLERHGRNDRRWNRDRRGWQRHGRAYGRDHSYRQQRCRTEWRRGQRIRVCRR